MHSLFTEHRFLFNLGGPSESFHAAPSAKDLATTPNLDALKKKMPTPTTPETIMRSANDPSALVKRGLEAPLKNVASFGLSLLPVALYASIVYSGMYMVCTGKEAPLLKNVKK